MIFFVNMIFRNFFILFYCDFVSSLDFNPNNYHSMDFTSTVFSQSVLPSSSESTVYNSMTKNLSNQQYFIVKPSDVEIIEGDTVTLQCQVGNQLGAVQWSKNGLLLGNFCNKLPSNQESSQVHKNLVPINELSKTVYFSNKEIFDRK